MHIEYRRGYLYGTKKYISNQGKECEFITYATDTETRQKLIVYRESVSGDIFVCSESWWNDQGFLSLAEESEQYVALPRGLFDDIVELFTEKNITVNIEDKTNPGNEISVEFKGELRPEQNEAKNALITKNYGVLSASTGQTY